MSQEPPEKKEIRKIEVGLFEDTVCDAWAYQRFIEKHIRQGNKIPARVLKKFLTYIDFGEQGLLQREWSISQIAKNVGERFTNTDYEFDGTHIAFSVQDDLGNIEQEITMPYSLKIMIENICKEIFELFDERNNHLTKDECLATIHEKIESYKDGYLSDEHKQKFTSYKMYVLASYITIQFSFKLTEKKDPTNEELYHCARNAITKQKRKAPKN